MQINELPKPSYMQKTLREIRIGSYNNIEVATEDTSIITALHKFVDRRVSALPIVDGERRLKDIYAKFDVIVSLHRSSFGLGKFSFKIDFYSRIWLPRRPTTIWMFR